MSTITKADLDALVRKKKTKSTPRWFVVLREIFNEPVPIPVDKTNYAPPTHR